MDSGFEHLPYQRQVKIKKKRESSLGTCTRILFQASSGHNRRGTKSKEQIEEAEVQQIQGAKEDRVEVEGGIGSPVITKQKAVEIDKVVESLGDVYLSIEGTGEDSQSKGFSVQKR